MGSQSSTCCRHDNASTSLSKSQIQSLEQSYARFKESSPSGEVTKDYLFRRLQLIGGLSTSQIDFSNRNKDSITLEEYMEDLEVTLNNPRVPEIERKKAVDVIESGSKWNENYVSI